MNINHFVRNYNCKLKSQIYPHSCVGVQDIRFPYKWFLWNMTRFRRAPHDLALFSVSFSNTHLTDLVINKILKLHNQIYHEIKHQIRKVQNTNQIFPEWFITHYFRKLLKYLYFHYSINSVTRWVRYIHFSHLNH